MNRSNDHVVANASFSICEYRCSVGVIALEACATGRNVPLVLCRRTAQVHTMTRQLTPSSLDLGRTTPAQAFCSARPSPGQMHVVGSYPTSTDSSSVADPSRRLSHCRQVWNELAQLVCHAEEASDVTNVFGYLHLLYCSHLGRICSDSVR